MAIAETSSGQTPAQKLKHAWKALPDAWALLSPRRGILFAGLLLMAINRVAGFILPGSTKYLVDDVINKRQIHLLGPLVLVVMAATVRSAAAVKTVVSRRRNDLPVVKTGVRRSGH